MGGKHGPRILEHTLVRQASHRFLQHRLLLLHAAVTESTEEDRLQQQEVFGEIQLVTLIEQGEKDFGT